LLTAANIRRADRILKHLETTDGASPECDRPQSEPSGLKSGAHLHTGSTRSRTLGSMCPFGKPVLGISLDPWRMPLGASTTR